jgi:Tfp pilus assembly protein PilF
MPPVQSPPTEDTAPSSQQDSVQEFATAPDRETESNAPIVQGSDIGKALFQRLYKIPEFNLIQWRGDDNEMDEITVMYTQAVKAFEQNDYKKALSLLPDEIDGRPSSMSFQYLKAHCLLKLGRFSDAARYLTAASSDPYFDRQDEARWNLLLCYTAINQFNQAQTIQKEIEQDEFSDYRQESKNWLIWFKENYPAQKIH